MELRQGTLDARGRVLEEGDEIILNTHGNPLFFRVMKIVPAVDPSLPPDMLMVHIGALIPFVAQRGKRNGEFIRVRTREEAGPINVEILDIKPPAGEPGSGT